jgi:hypothetical protein
MDKSFDWVDLAAAIIKIVIGVPLLFIKAAWWIIVLMAAMKILGWI